MNSGCICCSLVGDFSEALKKVLAEYHPERIIIEPSGVGKLSDVIKAVQGVAEESEICMNSFTTVADAQKCRMYMKNFGEFFNNQIEYANTIILSRTQNLNEEKLQSVTHDIRGHNAHATMITTPWDELNGEQILEAMEQKKSLEKSCWRKRTSVRHAISTMTTIMSMVRDAVTTMTTITCMMRNAVTTMTTITSKVRNAVTTMAIITSMGKAAAVGIIMIITIIMRMRCLPAGEWKPYAPMGKRSFAKFWRNSPIVRNTASSCVLREC